MGFLENDEVLLHITSNEKINYIDINSIFDSGEIDCYEQEEILLPRNFVVPFGYVITALNPYNVYAVKASRDSTLK